MNERPVNHDIRFDELLAEYVDGTLRDEDRTALLAHVSDCGYCTQALELASEARRRLAGLPELPPPDLAEAVARHPALRLSTPAAMPAGTLRPARSRHLWQRAAWGGGIAAAAVVVGLFLFLGGSPLTGGGGGAETGAARGGGGGMSSEAASQPDAALRVPARRTYTESSLEDLARSIARQVRGLQPSPAAPRAQSALFATSRPPRGRGATCVRAGAGLGGGSLFDVRKIRFGGQRAYLGLVLRQPRGGSRRPSVLVAAVDRADCRLLHLSRARV